MISRIQFRYHLDDSIAGRIGVEDFEASLLPGVVLIELMDSNYTDEPAWTYMEFQ